MFTNCHLFNKTFDNENTTIIPITNSYILIRDLPEAGWIFQNKNPNQTIANVKDYAVVDNYFIGYRETFSLGNKQYNRFWFIYNMDNEIIIKCETKKEWLNKLKEININLPTMTKLD